MLVKYIGDGYNKNGNRLINGNIYEILSFELVEPVSMYLIMNGGIQKFSYGSLDKMNNDWKFISKTEEIPVATLQEDLLKKGVGLSDNQSRLLEYLFINMKKACRVEDLVGVFYRDSVDDAYIKSIRVEVSRLRRKLNDKYVIKAAGTGKYMLRGLKNG